MAEVINGPTACMYTLGKINMGKIISCILVVLSLLSFVREEKKGMQPILNYGGYNVTRTSQYASIFFVHLFCKSDFRRVSHSSSHKWGVPYIEHQMRKCLSSIEPFFSQEAPDNFCLPRNALFTTAQGPGAWLAPKGLFIVRAKHMRVHAHLREGSAGARSTMSLLWILWHLKFYKCVRALENMCRACEDQNFFPPLYAAHSRRVPICVTFCRQPAIQWSLAGCFYEALLQLALRLPYSRKLLYICILWVQKCQAILFLFIINLTGLFHAQC